MTASNPQRDEPTGTAHLDSTAQLMTRITSQLGTQLSHVRLNGSRRFAPSALCSPPLVVVAHGSRDPRALTTVNALLDKVRAERPEVPVHLGHIELDEPLLTDTLANLAPGRVILAPLLLSRGYHVKQDIPEALAKAPHLTASVAAPLGPHPLLVETLYARLVEAGWNPTPDARTRRTTGVVLAAAGSRDPDAATDTARTAEMLAERLGVPVLPAYASAASPTVPAALRALAARGRHRVAVAAYFTAPGRFATQCAQAAPGTAAAPLGAHTAMARLLLHRYDAALNAAHTPTPTPTLTPVKRQLTSA
ncbi:sirohydrochlorin chelatase [Streptomyces sp. NPDC058067]|uniref:sirohydrochlorin chelatase n=1 Tax=Streptomyces sp. NPDC058067 TaxID=3346324 RepID=UPI0036E2BA44